MKTLSIICAVVLSICWAAFASPPDMITVHFATPVAVGNTTLPAGDVTINVQRGATNVFLTFRSESGVTATALANRINDLNEERPESTTVVLSREANGLHVDRVWLGDHTGFALAQ